MAYRAGDIISKYTIRGELGRGQFGAVYLVDWLSLKGVRQGALKILVREQTIKSILDEVSTWARVSHHPNILTFIGATEHNRQILLISEYAQGGSLDTWIKQRAGKKETVNDAIRLMLGILSGLYHLHESEIVHRDVKPANILLNEDNPLLADFGLARDLDLAQSSILAGTVSYMSPELVNAFLNQRSRTNKYERTEADDLWAAAVTFYEMLASDVPFESVSEIISSNPCLLPSHIPSRLQDFVAKTLNKELSQRFQTAEEMRTALDDCRICLQRESLVATVSSDDWLERQRDAQSHRSKFPGLNLMNPADFKRALELDEAGAYFDRGLIFANFEKYDAAIADWNKAIELYPPYQAAYNNRGLAYTRTDELDRAMEDFNKAIALLPGDGTAYLNRGVAQRQRRSYREAIRDYSKAIELNPLDAAGYSHRASAYSVLGNYDEAIRNYSEAIALDPSNSDILLNRGNCFRKKGDLDGAIKDVSSAIHLDPHDAEAYRLRGIIYEEKGSYKEAITDFSRSIELRPDLALTYNDRAWTYHNLNDYSAALRDLDTAIELDSNFAIAYSNRASVYARLGDTLKAKADREKFESLMGIELDWGGEG